MLFLELKKAFDSVEHYILLRKLRNAGLTETCVMWFQSYLSNRAQRTKVNGVMSQEMRIEYGVPQDSILSVLLFIIFINDLPLNLGRCRTHIYADDTAISVSGTTMQELEHQLNDRLQKASDWMMRNHPTLNCRKMKVMCFGTAHTLGIVDQTPPRVMLNDSEIENAYEFEYLGVILDQKLIFSGHVEYLKGKAIGRLKMLGKTCKFVDGNTSLLLYKTLMAPVFDYADVVYDCLNSRDSHTLQRLQNSAFAYCPQEG